MKNKVYIFMIISTVLWGGSFVIGKSAVTEFPPMTLTFFRYLISTAIIFPLMLKKEGKKARIKIKDLPIMLTLSLTGGFGYVILYFSALSYTTAINSSLIVAVNPLMTLIISALILKEKLTFIKLSSVLLALFGVTITIFNGFNIFSGSVSINPGDLIMFAGVILYSFYSVFSNKIMHKYSPLIITGYTFFISLLFMIPISIAEKPWEIWMKSSFSGKLSVIYLGALASAIGYLFHQYSIKLMGASKSMGFYSLVPVFASFFSVLFLHEEITFNALLGGIIIIFGIYLNYNCSKRELTVDN